MQKFSRLTVIARRFLLPLIRALILSYRFLFFLFRSFNPRLSVLNALATKQCIHPDGSQLYCTSPRTTIGSCHRFDQSVMGILNVNSEYKRSLIGMKI
uniref:Secreted protein n=1 Tax=Meloidogyne incognita TaxID=6306 RepID=A0A914MN06_MELIC